MQHSVDQGVDGLNEIVCMCTAFNTLPKISPEDVEIQL